MPLTYSRDALADVMAKLYRVVSAIRSGEFNPDVCRAERVGVATAGHVVLPPDALELPDDDQLEDGPGHESDVSAEDLEPQPTGLDVIRPFASSVTRRFCLEMIKRLTNT